MKVRRANLNLNACRRCNRAMLIGCSTPHSRAQLQFGGEERKLAAKLSGRGMRMACRRSRRHLGTNAKDRTDRKRGANASVAQHRTRERNCNSATKSESSEAKLRKLAARLTGRGKRMACRRSRRHLGTNA
ncbi:uncharacterized protein Dvir_GJ26026 [Drosophila virilis]|uniref:Uncharacterized protein n=1 Tax=Drosophila virilis TaxID=7244 RepID=A0A0Q9W9B6_DROVI|nr:uncharacterized protein Dvir_GJ26026 [Drosophila virilis]